MSDTASPAASAFCPAEKRIYVLVAAILASSMGFIDGSVVSIALPSIRTDLGASLPDAQWISNGYLLLLSSLLLIGGAVGDRFGLRTVFAIGIGAFVAASLICAIAPTPALLIAARLLQGAGAALMVPGSLAIIAKAYPREERGKAIGVWATASTLTTLLGPILGGYAITLLGDWSWRLVFAINLPLGAIALFLLLTQVPPDSRSDGRRLDLVGGLLATVALALIAFGLTGEGEAGLPTASRLFTFGGIGVAVLIAFLIWETRTKEPMLPLRLFANRSFSGAQGLTFALYAALGGLTFFLPMALITGWLVSPGEVATAMLPFSIALTLLSSWAGRLSDRFGPGPLIAGGSLLVALASVGLGLTASSHSIWFAVAPLMALMGIGMGFVVSPLSVAVMTSLPDSESGIASAVNNAVARVAGLFAVAAMASLAAVIFSSGVPMESGLSFGLLPETAQAELEAARVTASDAAWAAIAYSNAALAAISAVIAWVTLDRKLPGARPS